MNATEGRGNSRGRAGDGVAFGLTAPSKVATVRGRGVLMGTLLAVLLLSCAAQGRPADKASEEPGLDNTVTLIERKVERELPIESGDEWYVHTFVLDIVGLQNPSAWRPGKGFPVYKIVQTSEGPYAYSDADQRKREIRDRGLEIGTHFWPISQVQRVEIRPHTPPN